MRARARLRAFFAPPPSAARPCRRARAAARADDLDSYFSGTKEGGNRKEAKAGSLDDDLDSYFAKKE